MPLGASCEPVWPGSSSRVRISYIEAQGGGEFQLSAQKTMCLCLIKLEWLLAQISHIRLCPCLSVQVAFVQLTSENCSLFRSAEAALLTDGCGRLGQVYNDRLRDLLSPRSEFDGWGPQKGRT